MKSGIMLPLFVLHYTHLFSLESKATRFQFFQVECRRFG